VQQLYVKVSENRMLSNKTGVLLGWDKERGDSPGILNQ